MHASDTICAIATPLGEGGIGVIRVSGPNAIVLVSRFFKGKNLLDLPSHQMVYGDFFCPGRGETLDHVLCTIMRAPHSYTGEDVVEVSGHGNPRLLASMVQRLIQAGARLAERGEFTKRAFLNGKLDLTQAEAVMDLVKARTSSAIGAAVHQLDGKLGKSLREIRQSILSALSPIEAGIDFPEEDVPEAPRPVLEAEVQKILAQMKEILDAASAGRILREGVCAVIAGKPNVGKSSLLNALLGESRAIVTEIPGTTRDTVEEWADLQGIPVRLVDTAGIRSSTDPVELMGIARSKEAVARGDLLLLVLDRATPLESYDLELLESAKDRKSIVILNKMDLAGPIQSSDVRKFYSGPLVCLSVLRNQGLDALQEKIIQESMNGEVVDAPLVTRLRHQQGLERAKQFLKEALDTLKKKYPLDLAALDLRGASEAIGEITGERYTEDLLEKIFSEFCIGK